MKPPLRITPTCAEPGDSVLVEVNFLPRVYHSNVIHSVYLDRTPAFFEPTIYTENVPTWTPRWTQKVRIPPGTAHGTHSIAFAQYEFNPPNVSWHMTACAVYLNFTVADTSGVNPWRDSLKVAPAGDTLILRFDPSGICGIPKCDTIHLVQVVRATGLDTLMNTRLLSYAEQAFPNAAVRDSERTAAGWRVDVTIDDLDPFYTEIGQFQDFVGRPGRSGDTTVVAFLRDAPGRGLISYPGDIQRITLDFEACAVCSHGEGIGSFLGRYLWRWERPRAGPYVITRLGGTREPPSAQFGEALDLWRSRHPNFTLPVTRYPFVGGTPCP